MPKFLLHRRHGIHFVWGFVLILFLTVVLTVYEWVLGAVGLILAGVLFAFALRAEKAFREELEDYILTLSLRIKKAGSEVIHELPVGIILYNEEKEIEWHNPFVGGMLGKDSVIGEGLAGHFPALAAQLKESKDAKDSRDAKESKEQEEQQEIRVGNDHYLVLHKPEERLVYFFRITDYVVLRQTYEDERPAIGIVMLDNLDEVTQNLDEQTRSILLARVVAELTEWAGRYGIFLRRLAADRFMIIMNHKTLQAVEQSRFEILDEVRDLTAEQKLPLTLSIGISSQAGSLVELGAQAQTSLDMALGRGGDQAAVKHGERMVFYGGRSNAVEKRTRVRARVISHALRDLMKDSDKIIIMGHKMPDMDAIGAAIGVLKAAQIAKKDAYIVLGAENPGISRLMEEVRRHEHLAKWIISPEQALQITGARSLVVMVDTHKPSMVEEPKVLEQTDRIVIVDHHRRGEEFLRDAILVYLEPYASSTCELVTELLQYIDENVTLQPFEATALLAGISVDTKSFSLRTGARTFEAASFLRRHGADISLVQNMLKEDLDHFHQKMEIIRGAYVLKEHIAIARAEPGRKYPQLLIAQAADSLLGISNIHASFVIAERKDGGVGISARSLGQMNVQVVMEQLGGGGHLTNAAARLDATVEEAEKRLLEVLEENSEEKGMSE